MNRVRVEVKDLMQQGYIYQLTEPTGQHLHRNFHPELTPKQMLHQLDVLTLNAVVTIARSAFRTAVWRTAARCGRLRSTVSVGRGPIHFLRRADIVDWA